MFKMSLISALFFMSCSEVKVMKKKNEIIAPFDGQKFDNLEPFADKSFFDVLKWRVFGGKKAKWESVKNQVFYKPELQRSEDLVMTMIGHSTVLIQMNGLNILTDPHYSKRASPVSWAGPKRVVDPAIKFEDLPPIDIVLISHNHYDHLDLKTLKRLSERGETSFYVGLGNKSLLNESGIKNVIEMDWWQKEMFKGLGLHFVPVQHWSARSLFDKRETLWGGFILEGKKNVFFGGDTGYGKVFQDIHKKHPKLDVGLIPIGAYKPREFMKNAHVNPSESVKIFQDLGLQHGFGIHFGTFAGLTDEAIDQPKKDLEAALDKQGIAREQFVVPLFGKAYWFK
jgi:L-ascorbate metabolism protein UlaG (beta-lactamase superfamily)